MPRAAGLPGIFAVGLLLRLAFVAWAPRELSGDAAFYHTYGHALSLGWGYVEVDGSPGIRWMPGWPATLAALYTLFGVAPLAGMIWNALLGAATAALVASLGTRWLGSVAGRAAGWISALWPGLVYYSATLFTEPTFAFLLTATLWLLARAAGDAARRTRWAAAAGVGLGLCAMVKAEPLALAPALLFFLWRIGPGWPQALRTAVVLFVAAGAVIAPWSVRNYQVFGRFIPTSANGGAVVYLGNHAGAHGGNDFAAAKRYARLHAGADTAASILARNEAGWRDAWRFAREHPAAEAQLMLRKLRLTYAGDSDGATLVRGLGTEPGWFLDRATWRRLAIAADAWWWAILALAAVGAAAPRHWPPGARPLLFGVLGTWLGLHLLFLGGARFHVPETPVLALLAGCGVETLVRRLRRAD